MNIELDIIYKAIRVEFECPFCEEEVSMPYPEFGDYLGSNEECDWQNSTISCPVCDKKVTISEIHW